MNFLDDLIGGFLGGGGDLLELIPGGSEFFGQIFGQLTTGLLESLLVTFSESGSLEQLDTLSFGEPPEDVEVPDLEDE
ncbi:hypothetical protein ONR57_17290 [Hoyosella sp. YIM 151337]|uniref:hypothetical protein n=1 Tax=Hoyosella sp. YIM 151337 TaxID=2992742 RepID=UPI002236C084|nr:hypothetical protein [Hoyosella sp. YIM 151337]MCW4355062.1 hypothetical protein [Hoyosella sp. YIM 151337]